MILLPAPQTLKPLLLSHPTGATTGTSMSRKIRRANRRMQLPGVKSVVGVYSQDGIEDTDDRLICLQSNRDAALSGDRIQAGHHPPDPPLHHRLYSFSQYPLTGEKHRLVHLPEQRASLRRFG